MTVSVTLTFASIDEAMSFLGARPTLVASAPRATSTPAPAPAAAPTTPTAAVEVAAAPAEKPKALDFQADVVEALRAFSKRDAAAFKALMTELKVTKVTDLESRQSEWAAIIARCNG